MSELTNELRDWVDVNLGRGGDKDVIFKVLYDRGISAQTIEAYMGYRPSVSIQDIVNPFSENEQVNHHRYPQKTLFLPNAQECISGESRVLRVDQFLNNEEVDAIFSVITPSLEDFLKTQSQSELDKQLGQFTYRLGALNNAIIAEVDRRICKWVGVDPRCGEDLLIQMVNSQEAIQQEAFLDNSVFSVVIYLSGDKTQNSTQFPLLNASLEFGQGDLLFWQNKASDNSIDQQMCYYNAPDNEHQQYMLVKRFYLNDELPMYRKTLSEMVENYTELGIHKIQLPNEFMSTLTNFYHSNKNLQEDEFSGEDDFIKTTEKNIAPTTMTTLPVHLCDYVHDYMQPLLESWTGTLLEATYVYGIRTYHNKSILKPHRDRIATHIISCIINVYQDVDMEWPLQIEDNFYRKHSVILKPGEAIFYESARLEHSRVEPFQGRAYANVFCHFKPIGYVPPDYV